MKNLSLTTLLIIITLGFSSCSQDDSIALQEPTAEDMLKSFNLNKSNDGGFSLNYELGSGISADNVLDEKTNTNNIFLYSSESEVQSRRNQQLSTQNGSLRVDFNNTEKNTNHSITILDDDIKMSRTSNEYLESYGIAGSGDGSYELGFTVKDGISVDFIYDGDRGVYEVHLNNDSNASQSVFSETFTKEEGVALNIEFVNDEANRSSSRDGDDGTGGDNPNRPVIIIENGGNG